MLYQETYQAGGDPTKLNISGVLYTRNSYPFLPPPRRRKSAVSRRIVILFTKLIIR